MESGVVDDGLKFMESERRQSERKESVMKA